MDSYFLDIARGILTENINITKASDAIRKRNEVKISYDDDGGGVRIIQPVAYGLSKSGNMVLRAFQPYGTTKTKVPHWKLFRMDKIMSWKTLKNRIFQEPPGQFSSEGKYNPNGDDSMIEVYLNANFERSKNYHSGKQYQGLKKYNIERQNSKEKEDPFYSFKKNLKNSYISKDVKDRVDKNKSQQAQNYVNGNDKYQEDMFKLDNMPKNTNISIEPITKTGEDKNDQNNNIRPNENENNIEINKKTNGEQNT